MNSADHWLAASAVVAMVAALIIGVRTWRLPPFPGRSNFILLLLAVFWWTACSAAEHESATLYFRSLWTRMAWLGITATPSCWALFIWNYIHGQSHPAPRVWGVGLSLVALVTWALAMTNDSHHLMYEGISSTGASPDILYEYNHGFVYFIISVFFYVLMLFSEFAIFYYIARSRNIYRVRYVGLAVASLFPWAFHATYVTNIITSFDPTPFSLVVAGCIFYWLISRQHIFDLLPVAHGTLFDVIPDPILVLDGEHRIAACNAAARRLISDRNPVGQVLESVPELKEALVQLPESTAADRYEATIGNPARFFDVGQDPLTYAGREIGRLVLLRDVTYRRNTECRLQAALGELQKQLHANIVLQQQLREETIRDTLTGLHNRRFLGELAPVLLAEAERAVLPLVAVMVDIDHFKRLNDTYGHQAGDVVLRGLGIFLRENTRQGDAVFRMGGEEFLILVPHTQEDDALARIEAWRTGFMALNFSYEGVPLGVTFSAGAALYPTEATNLSDLLRYADQALYQAKLEGRNRCVRWHPALSKVRERV